MQSVNTDIVNLIYKANMCLVLSKYFVLRSFQGNLCISNVTCERVHLNDFFVFSFLFFFFSGYSQFAPLRADCPHLSQSRFLSVLYNLSVACSMNYARAMLLKSKSTCTTLSNNSLRPSSLGCAKVAPAPCWRCSTCIQQWSRPHRRSTSLTMTKTMPGASTGTERKCPSRSLIRLPLRRALPTSSLRRSPNASLRWTPPSSCWSLSASPPPELCQTTHKC